MNIFEINPRKLKENFIKRLTISDFNEIIGEESQSEDLHVLISKGVVPFPITYPFRSSEYDLVFVVSGELKIRINLITYKLGKFETVGVSPKSVLQIIGTSDDLKIIVISFSNKFIFDNFFNKTGIDAFDYFTINNTPKLQLNKKEGKVLKTLAKLLKFYNKQEYGVFKEDIIRNTFGVIIFNYAEIFKRAYPDLEVELTRQEELTVHFWNILEENVKSERTVQFYANALNVTTGHLSKVLKEVTGKTASQVIERAVMLEARLLLEDPKLSIAQIAEELQFPDQSFFGKYFKKHMGLAPSVYRSQNRD